jgi:hypothetical protein
LRGEDGGDLASRCLRVLGRRRNEVDVACEGGEGRLDGVEEDGVCEAGVVRSVCGGGDALLEEGPRQAENGVSTSKLRQSHRYSKQTHKLA